MPGEYDIDALLAFAIPADCVLEIDGPGAVFTSSILDNGSSHGVWEITPNATSRLVIRGIELVNGTALGANRSLCGILTKATCKSVLLDRVISSGWNCSGARIQTPSEWSLYQYCQMSSNKRHGLLVEGGGKDPHVWSGIYNDNGETVAYGYGVEIGPTSAAPTAYPENACVEHIYAKGNLRRAVDMHGGGRYAKVLHNYIEDWGYAAIAVISSAAGEDKSTDVVLDDNTLNGAGITQDANSVYGLELGSYQALSEATQFQITRNTFKNMNLADYMTTMLLRSDAETTTDHIWSVLVQGNKGRDCYGAKGYLFCKLDVIGHQNTVKEILFQNNDLHGGNTTEHPIFMRGVEKLNLKGNVIGVGTTGGYVLIATDGPTDVACEQIIEGNNISCNSGAPFYKDTPQLGRQLIKNNIVNALPGYIMGSDTIASGATTKAVTFATALYTTPRIVRITFKEQGTADYGRWWVSALASTGFTLNVSVDPGVSNLDFDYEAEV